MTREGGVVVKRSDKVLLMVVGGILLLAGLCAVCLVGGLFLPYHWWTQGGPSQAAKDFLASDPILRERVGAIRDFGIFPSGSVNEVNGKGKAHLEFSLKGDKGNGRALVDLAKEPNKEWRVIAARLYVGDREFILKAGPASEGEPLQKPDGKPPAKGTDGLST